MHPDQTKITIQREGTRITVRTAGQATLRAASDAIDSERGYGDITTPLRQRGLEPTVEYGLSDYIVVAELPNGDSLVISPPQEPPTDHPPGHPASWLATSGPLVVYDSAEDGPHAQFGGNVPQLLAAVDAHLDHLGIPPRLAPSRELSQGAADALLHRAGFVPVVLFRERYHRLPSGMTDPVEQRQTVTRAFDTLQAEGFDVSCDPDLLDPSLPYVGAQEMSLGDRLGHLARSIHASTHTTEAVAALSELTAPEDGVLQRVVEILNTTADWWQGLGESADPHHAGRLRYIAERLDSYALEIRAMRGDLADRHTTHPDKLKARLGSSSTSRADTALAISPNASRPVPSSPPIPSAHRTPPAQVRAARARSITGSAPGAAPASTVPSPPAPPSHHRTSRSH
ncbi:hypothetical protein ABZ832_12380 [Streptantibioticus parmotrematis]|uniref:hypothetical protein n=1 Tax=Streptantibioticus parmotrematis TaxID=2873249 RepID=UPI003404934E